MRIHSFQVGKPAPHVFEGKTIWSAIEKQPMDGEVFLSRVNFTGDAQGDLINHGGPDKAVCVYAYEHYSFWEKELSFSLTHSAFGENLTVEGWTEQEACIGDIYRIGSALVQVSQPRKPCYKLAMKHGIADIAKRVVETGFTGFYLRVLEEGVISQMSEITLVQKHPLEISVACVNEVTHHRKEDLESVRQLISLTELSERWRQSLEKRLQAP